MRVRENSIRFSDTELLVGGVYSKTPGWEKNHNIYFFFVCFQRQFGYEHFFLISKFYLFSIFNFLNFFRFFFICSFAYFFFYFFENLAKIILCCCWIRIFISNAASAFSIFSLNPVATFCSDLFDFCIKSRRVHDLSYSNFSAAKNFFGEIYARKILSFWILEKGKGYSFRVLYFQLARNSLHFWTNRKSTIQFSIFRVFLQVYGRPVLLRRKTELFEFFRNKIDTPHCPLHFFLLPINLYKNTSRIYLLSA